MGRSEYRHLVTLLAPTTPATSDPDGTYVLEPYTPLTPPWYCSIQPIAAHERSAAGTSTSETAATHVLRGDYRPDLTTAIRLQFGARIFHVTDVTNHDERNVSVTLLATELQP